jgi:hypothetical protein
VIPGANRRPGAGRHRYPDPGRRRPGAACRAGRAGRHQVVLPDARLLARSGPDRAGLHAGRVLREQ